MLVAADRGVRCLERMLEIKGTDDQLTVFTFKETPWEPKFVDKILNLSKLNDFQAFVTSKVDNEDYQKIWEQKPDLILVIGWRYLIPKRIYDAAKIGCFVFHDSLLPEYRGFSPTVWSIRNGEKYTGATLFKIVEAMDEGPILLQRKVTINDDEYIGEVVEKVTNAYLDILQRAYIKLKSGDINLNEQDNCTATYTCKVKPEDFEIDWSKSAHDIKNLIRSYSHPYPGAHTYLGEQKLTLFNIEIDTSNNYVGLIPGRIVKIEKRGVFVAASNALILIKDVYVNGQKHLAKDVLKSINLTLGKKTHCHCDNKPEYS
ncbi:methionyl-tRNA formyltransferase [uncultured Ferrimonas sp.]|uniref:methionyl-tRNA formyltransferase n=1 Tax=uncultured Ferrimonas sp. TaxID=432640 RepID=UPI002626AF55|nr:methionyl-tRNA formyltransferase [uncultured Ferrimonas sp.]